MKYRVEIGGEAVEVELVERDGSVFAMKDGAAAPVELIAIRNGAYSLLLGTESHAVVASGGNDDLTLTIGSGTWRCAVLDERGVQAAAALGGAAGRAKGGLVRAVMPGIVREVLVKTGDTVKRGAPLLILEAMKMQNEVRAETDGIVAAVHAEAGTAVAKGDVLVALG